MGSIIPQSNSVLFDLVSSKFKCWRDLLGAQTIFLSSLLKRKNLQKRKQYKLKSSKYHNKQISFFFWKQKRWLLCVCVWLVCLVCLWLVCVVGGSFVCRSCVCVVYVWVVCVSFVCVVCGVYCQYMTYVFKITKTIPKNGQERVWSTPRLQRLKIGYSKRFSIDGSIGPRSQKQF